MKKDEKEFILFLLEIAKKRGADRLYFVDDEYNKFPGHGLLLDGMIKKGFLEWRGDIVDGIEITPRALSTLKDQ